ncbi:unnamed protein product [Mytilus edulis]|uniref:Uncharacterized protein n=1 Tax=Mytilus edulis TaxID=6550 RepID=A0A8S3RUR3_MYTED|nr:unnamed protein product [Mytilus edulis]
MKQIENSIVKDEEFVESLIENRSICQVGLDLKYTIDTEFLTVGMPSIGQVGVDYSPRQVIIMKKKEMQAQTKATKAMIRPIANIALKIEKKISACGGGVTGCTLLPHGTIAFANEKKRNIIVVKYDGSLDFHIDLNPYAPFDITYIPNTNAITVTSKSSKDIKIVDINARGVLKTYCLDSPCAGISYSENKIILCSLEKGILELNQHDGSVKTIVSDKMDSFSHVACLGNKIYYTKSHNQSVICCDLQGNIQWTFKNPTMTYPIGVSVDTDGNVYVAFHYSRNVVVISSDGQQHKQMLSSKDGVYIPNGLIYDRHNNQLLVTNYSKGAVLYNVT